MTKVLTRDQIEREQQEFRCRAALKAIDVPDDVIWKLEGPILFQVAHMCCVLEDDRRMSWRDALRWCWDNRGEIIEHARKQLIEKQQYAASEGQGASSNNAPVSGDQGQPVRVGTNGLPVGSKEHTS